MINTNDLSIDIESLVLSDKSILVVERNMDAKYICDSQIKTKTGYAPFPAAFFYTEKAHPEGSNYFAMYYVGKNLMITDGVSILEQSITGIVVDNIVYFSRSHHDFVKIGDYSIDGGRDYNKIGYRTSPPLRVTLKVEKDKLTIS